MEKEVNKHPNFGRTSGERLLSCILRWEPVFRGERRKWILDRARLLTSYHFIERRIPNQRFQIHPETRCSCHADCFWRCYLPDPPCGRHVPDGASDQYCLLCAAWPVVFAALRNADRHHPHGDDGNTADSAYGSNLWCIPVGGALSYVKGKDNLCCNRGNHWNRYHWSFGILSCYDFLMGKGRAKLDILYTFFCVRNITSLSDHKKTGENLLWFPPVKQQIQLPTAALPTSG